MWSAPFCRRTESENRHGRLSVFAKVVKIGKIRTVMETALLCAVSCIALAGCSVARPMTLPNGAQGMLIGCNGIYLSMSDCYLKAGQTCPRGYDIIGVNGEAVPMIAVSAGSAVGTSIVSRSLMIRCH